MSNLPIFRAKKINSDEYIIGQYIETEFSNEEYCDIEEQEIIIKHCIIKDFRTVHDDYEYCNFDITEIDIATLAIHFPDMLDSNGNKIFASLSENGKGGDIMLREYENWYGNNYPKKIYIEKEELITYFDDGLKFIEKINKKQSVFGLTTAKKCKVIGIQE